MTDKLDDLLRALPAVTVDHALDQLEPLVWRRIEAARASQAVAGGAWRYQLAAAGMALAIGVALGWSTSSMRSGEPDQALYTSYAELGPAARLSGL